MSNIFSLVGTLGQDSELKTLGSTEALVFSVANNLGFGDKKRTQWIRCILWGKRGESIAQYMKKGTSVFLAGELEMKEFTNKEGVTKNSLEMNVSICDFVGGKKESSSPAPSQPNADDENDDIPF